MARQTLVAPVITTGPHLFQDIDIPLFPDDVPTAPLLRLSLRKLLDGDEDESNRLFQASKDLGFFYLDLRNTPDGEWVLEDVDELFRVGEDLFDLSVEEKQKYDFSKERSYFGYKGYGQAIIDKEGNRDKNEFYNISKDDILNLSPPLPAPPLLITRRPLFTSYIITSHSILSLLLTHLTTHLHLPPAILVSLHRLLAPSGDQIRLLKAPPQDPATAPTPALGPHTDFGSLTLLFSRVGGLQVLPPSPPHPTQERGWLYVRPLPGHAIVNLGDALRLFTNGLLRSNLHRVVPAPGVQGRVAKFSVVYFMRPEDEVTLGGLEGGDVIPALEGGRREVVSSKEWVLRRALGRRVGGTGGD